MLSLVVKAPSSTRPSKPGPPSAEQLPLFADDSPTRSVAASRSPVVPAGPKRSPRTNQRGTRESIHVEITRDLKAQLVAIAKSVGWPLHLVIEMSARAGLRALSRQLKLSGLLGKEGRP